MGKYRKRKRDDITATQSEHREVTSAAPDGSPKSRSGWLLVPRIFVILKKGSKFVLGDGTHVVRHPSGQ